MGYPVFDHCCDVLSAREWVCLDLDFDNKQANLQALAQIKGRVPQEVLAEITAHYAAQLQAAREHGYREDPGYWVAPDGRWHCDPHHAYLMAADNPHLSADQWLEADILLHKQRSTPQRS